MNVFVLNTGRCGSTTFAKACSHISNYSSGHEINSGKLGPARIDYPANHIEADNRLSWFLGKIDQVYGQEAFYVHLTRNRDQTARSYAGRYAKGIIPAYKTGILRIAEDIPPLDIAADYCENVTANIELFLKDKPNKMDFSIENAPQDFERFWTFIGAEGDKEAALGEFERRHNAAGKSRSDTLPEPIKKLIRKFRLMTTRK